MQPKVSLVVACYNKVLYIADFFQSVYAQKWNNIELILVNDGSTDGTREIIYEWKPRFIARGYDVVVFEQENQGVAAATKAGIGKITGDYVCFSDCDDILDPEYVSAMMDILLNNSCLDLVFSNVDTARGFENFEKLSKQMRYIPDADAWQVNNMAEMYLCGRIGCSLCGWIATYDFFSRCHIYDNFSTISRVTQECQVLIPLFYNKPIFKCLDRTLYFQIKNDFSQSYMRDYAAGKKNCEGLLAICNETIRSLGASDVEERRLLLLAEYFSLKLLAVYSRRFLNTDLDNPEISEKIAQLAKQANECLSTNFIKGRIVKSGADAFFRALTNHILGQTTVLPPLSRDGRVVGYGLGRFGKRILYIIRNTPLCPDELWDISAGDITSYSAIPVYKPKFNKLKQSDTVLVFIYDLKTRRELAASFKDFAHCTVLYYYDILDFLAAYYYPELNYDTPFS